MQLYKALFLPLCTSTALYDMVWNFNKNGNPSLVPAPLHHAATNISISRSTSVEQSLHNNDNSSLSITTDKNKLLSKKMQLLNSKPKNPAYFHQIGSDINGTTKGDPVYYNEGAKLFGLSVPTNEDGSIIFVGSPANESYSCEWISQADMFQFKDGESVNCREDVKVLKDFYESGGMKNNESAKMSSSHKSGELDVIIIGAGWAGLSAAITLEAKGITNYKILEARDYLGGRSHTVQETFDGKDIPIDMGSMWLHGGFKNPLYKVIETVGGIPFFKFKFNHKFYQENNGGPLPHKQFLDYHDQFLEDGFMDYQASRQESKSMDQPLKVSADKYINTLSVDLEKQAATKFIKDSIEFEYSAHMNELSLFWWDADHSLDGDLFLPEGYSSLVEAYAAPNFF